MEVGHNAAFSIPADLLRNIVKHAFITKLIAETRYILHTAEEKLLIKIRITNLNNQL